MSAFILNACDDELGVVGVTIQPDGDKSVIFSDTFALKAVTQLYDSVYAKSMYGLLGEFYDPMFGNLKSDYICQFYSSEGFRFEQTPIDGKIDSIALYIYYDRTNFIGDSLSPMQLKVFPIVKPLERNFYTNTDPEKYADMQNPIGQQAYTPRNMRVTDSVWNLPSTDDNYYTPNIKVTLPQELGQKFYDETINNPASFSSQESFNAFFPGLYVTNTFGSGNIIVVSNTVLTIHYRYLTESASGVVDSVANTYEVFTVTPEVIQLNNFSNTDISHLLEPNNDYTYMKTPAGIFTRLTIPTKEILARMEGRRVNNFNLSLKAMPQENWAYSLNPPDYLLLLPEDSLNSFFREGRLHNSITSYLSIKYADLTYDFGNTAKLLNYLIKNEPEREEMNFLAIPVDITTGQDSQGNTFISSIKHYMKPSGVRLRKEPQIMRFQIISSKYTSINGD
ncbi:MAG: DUF4270 domain-containing protein [Tannerellaceae bacterium]|jgi:hypothetical protein|nr:DUF4270 domain-containing protein [Tannerellaceae bacterium]